MYEEKNAQTERDRRYETAFDYSVDLESALAEYEKTSESSREHQMWESGANWNLAISNYDEFVRKKAREEKLFSELENRAKNIKKKKVWLFKSTKRKRDDALRYVAEGFIEALFVEGVKKEIVLRKLSELSNGLSKKSLKKERESLLKIFNELLKQKEEVVKKSRAKVSKDFKKGKNNQEKITASLKVSEIPSPIINCTSILPCFR